MIPINTNVNPQLIVGQPASDGIAIGTAVVVSHAIDDVFRIHVNHARCYSIDDFHRAVQQTKAQLTNFQQQIKERVEEAVLQIFGAHLAILEDKDLIEWIENCIYHGLPVPQAIKEAFEHYIQLFAQSSSPILRDKVQDMRDLSGRLIMNLTGEVNDVSDYQGRIVITSELLPSDILRYVAQKAEGIIITSGGITAHISILARSLQMPMILADAQRLVGISTGTRLLMDAFQGTIAVNPDTDVIATYQSPLDTHNKFSQGDVRSGKPHFEKLTFPRCS